MTLEKLCDEFVLCKGYSPVNVDELFDFLQKMYVKQLITIVDYYNIYRHLHTLGVRNANDNFEQQMIESL
jgi:hypothetical protein